MPTRNRNKPPLCSVCDTEHYGKDCPNPNPRISLKKKKAISCSGNSWACLVRSVTGCPTPFCQSCSAYAKTIIDMYERRRREQKTSDVLDIREMHYRELARVFGKPVTKLVGEDEFDKWLR